MRTSACVLRLAWGLGGLTSENILGDRRAPSAHRCADSMWGTTQCVGTTSIDSRKQQPLCVQLTNKGKYVLLIKHRARTSRIKLDLFG